MDKALNAITMITHDLKSPLNAILGGLDYIDELINEKNLDREEIRELLATIKTAGNNMLNLIQSMLRVERIEAGKEKIECRPTSGMSMILTDMVNTFRYQASVNKIKLITKIEQDLPTCCWDIDKIHYHVINNLISNAIKFVQPDGLVVISARVSNASMIISVADNGPGIPIEERKKVFDKYEKATNKSIRTFEGSGLGLYTAFLVVRQHGGAISINDGLDGKGVTFTISIPMHPFIPSHNCTWVSPESYHPYSRANAQ
jgi:signal transduction histidine kinase